METRRLGRIGHQSTVLIYGAAALAEVSQATADVSIQEALDAGVNHFDVAHSYGDAEERLGPWMPRIRDRIFLATKTGDRDQTSAYASIVDSLRRLSTSHVDLLQLHAVCTMAELDEVSGPDGALQGALRAQSEGLVTDIGITGHGRIAAVVHAEALRRFPFASVLTPLNAVLWRDPEFRDNFAALTEQARSSDTAMMTIKTAARQNWPGSIEGQPAENTTHATWYQPMTDAEMIRAAVSFVLSFPQVTGFATAGDVRLLAAQVAAEAHRMSQPEAEEYLADVPDYSSPFLAMPW